MIWLVAVVYRFRYYFAWAVSEAALIFSGFCFNGWEPRPGVDGREAGEEPCWDRYANTRIHHVEFSTSAAELPAHWNTCTRQLPAPLWGPVCVPRLSCMHTGMVVPGARLLVGWETCMHWADGCEAGCLQPVVLMLALVGVGVWIRRDLRLVLQPIHLSWPQRRSP